MSNSINLKSQTKKVNSRERDKNKSITSESGGSSQCDTPPLTDKEASTSSQGKYAGIGPESIQCMAEQIGVEINSEAAANLAEDVSFKLRQVINSIALSSQLMKKARVDTWDVNTSLILSDTSPVVGATSMQFVTFGEEDLCCQVEYLQNVTECAMTPQTYSYASTPSMSVEWITDDKSLNSSSNITIQLQNYYTKVARAILNLKKKLKDLAVEDLMSNTRIGPIFPNLFNLAVLVLNDDNLKALNVPAKKPLQSNVLDMMDALCANPCSLDTYIQQQFQRLFPVMVSNILSNGNLSEKMVAVLTKITRTWPSFATMGKEILYDYISKGPQSQLTAQMIKCLTALGRRALIECLANHLDYIDENMQAPRKNHMQLGLRETTLDAATCLLVAEPATYLEDYVMTDYSLYEMLGDSILPRRLLSYHKDTKATTEEESNPDPPDDDFMFLPLRNMPRKSRLKRFPVMRYQAKVHRDMVFAPINFKPEQLSRKFQFKVKGFRTLPVHRKKQPYVCRSAYNSSRSNSGVVCASGLLNRFRYRVSEKHKPVPIFGYYML